MAPAQKVPKGASAVVGVKGEEEVSDHDLRVVMSTA